LEVSSVRKVIIVGAGGRDFHNFNVVYRDDPETDVVAFTAAQVPGIEHRVYPARLAGRRYPFGIPVHPESRLRELIAETGADEVVFAYSDVSHDEVMHTASIALAAGADFKLLGPSSTMLESTKPLVAVCAVRTGSGKSQTTRRVAEILRGQGLRVALVRHPAPYHDLDGMRVQRFATLADIDASHPTIEEREEDEPPVELGMVVYAGADYKAVLARAELGADVLVWDGGNNDLPFVRPDLLIVVVDPLRPGQELHFHPGEANLRMADVVVVNKVDSANPAAVERVLADVRAVNPRATVVRAASPVTLGEGPPLDGKAVLVIEDGPTLTHGGMPSGAGLVAAREAGAGMVVDPRPYAVGSLAETLGRHPHIGPVLPAMGYSDEQLHELEKTINGTVCDVVVSGTPVDLARLVTSRHPIRHATYELEEIGEPTLRDVLAALVERASSELLPAAG
jgi:predicted GTPase